MISCYSEAVGNMAALLGIAHMAQSLTNPMSKIGKIHIIFSHIRIPHKIFKICVFFTTFFVQFMATDLHIYYTPKIRKTEHKLSR